MEIEIVEFLWRGLSAIVAGMFMGIERKFKGKPAGLKTNALVALGATVFVMAAFVFSDNEGTDMTRIIGQLVVGVGFLGAGVILQREKEDKVKGLATAATIWCSAAAGCLAGLGMIRILAVFTLMVVLINIIFGFLNKKVPQND